jgi:hypothetical protein
MRTQKVFRNDRMRFMSQYYRTQNDFCVHTLRKVLLQFSRWLPKLNFISQFLVGFLVINCITIVSTELQL